jgi:hypothetical protein
VLPPADGGGSRDWAAVEAGSGLSLPPDYKELVNVYGGGSLYGYINLLVPPPTRRDGELVERNSDHMEVLENLWSIDERRPPELAAVDDLRLVVWADTIDSDTVNWLVRPGESPEFWPIVVLHSDLEDCEIYPVTTTEFLAGLLARDFESEILTEQLELHNEHEPFAPYAITHPA